MTFCEGDEHLKSGPASPTGSLSEKSFTFSSFWIERIYFLDWKRCLTRLVYSTANDGDRKLIPFSILKVVENSTQFNNWYNAIKFRVQRTTLTSWSHCRNGTFSPKYLENEDDVFFWKYSRIYCSVSFGRIVKMAVLSYRTSPIFGGRILNRWLDYTPFVLIKVD